MTRSGGRGAVGMRRWWPATAVGGAQAAGRPGHDGVRDTSSCVPTQSRLLLGARRQPALLVARVFQGRGLLSDLQTAVGEPQNEQPGPGLGPAQPLPGLLPALREVPEGGCLGAWPGTWPCGGGVAGAAGAWFSPTGPVAGAGGAPAHSLGVLLLAPGASGACASLGLHPSAPVLLTLSNTIFIKIFPRRIEI